LPRNSESMPDGKKLLGQKMFVSTRRVDKGPNFFQNGRRFRFRVQRHYFHVLRVSAGKTDFAHLKLSTPGLAKFLPPKAVLRTLFYHFLAFADILPPKAVLRTLLYHFLAFADILPPLAVYAGRVCHFCTFSRFAGGMDFSHGCSMCGRYWRVGPVRRVRWGSGGHHGTIFQLFAPLTIRTYFWHLLHHLAPFFTVLDHFSPFWTILHRFGPFCTVLDHFAPFFARFRTILHVFFVFSHFEDEIFIFLCFYQFYPYCAYCDRGLKLL